MKIGAISHFGQGWGTSVLTTAIEELGVTSVRDEIYWSNVETEKGVYDFSSSKVNYADQFANSGVDLNLVFQFGNKLYDNGYTPYTVEGRKAFADFIVATLERYVHVASIEIGNEFNSNSFVSGPIAEGSISLRDEYYVEILKAVHDAVSERFPDLKILGGSTHSIPVDYFDDLFDLGTLDLLDGITVHPYTTPPEQFGDQIDLLKAAMGAHQVPIEVTEFGQEFDDASQAPAYLVKMIAVMSASGVASAQWYGLSEESWFPNMQLLNSDGSPAPAGQSFKFVQEMLLSAGDAENISDQSTVYLYKFGSHALVMWGEYEEVAFIGNVDFYDAQGEKIINFDGRLNPDEPIIAIFKKDIVEGKNIIVSHSDILADSYHDFDLTNPAGSTNGFDGPWSYFELSGTGNMSSLYTMGGGMASGEAWTPYVGSEWRRPLVVSATTINPVDFGNGKSPASDYSIVERFTARNSAEVTISGHWDVADTSADGVDIHILVNGVERFSTIIFDPENGNVLDLQLNHMKIKKGDTIDFVTGTNATSNGTDYVERRIQIIDENSTSETKNSGFHADLTQTSSSFSFAGSRAADKIWGGTGADEIYGEGGRDRIFGGESDDVLHGGDGNDLLRGLNGKDTLFGSTGADFLAGGYGADVFKFTSISDFQSRKGASDVIADYEAVDTIDLLRIDANSSRVGDQGWHFIGASTFDGDTGELRYRYQGANTIVEGDVDGDQKSDFSLTILGKVDLNAHSFSI